VVNFIMAEYKDNLLGEANSFLEVLEQVSRLAPLNKPVLIIGERGTGKELIANRCTFIRPLGWPVYLPELRGAE
jgi:psp operon transcriptional activator